jgi:hypothetical protein
MTGRASEVTLAADRAIVLASSSRQLDTQPQAICYVYLANVLDEALLVCGSLDRLADFELSHGDKLLASRYVESPL